MIKHGNPKIFTSKSITRLSISYAIRATWHVHIISVVLRVDILSEVVLKMGYDKPTGVLCSRVTPNVNTGKHIPEGYALLRFCVSRVNSPGQVLYPLFSVIFQSAVGPCNNILSKLVCVFAGYILDAQRVERALAVVVKEKMQVYPYPDFGAALLYGIHVKTEIWRRFRSVGRRLFCDATVSYSFVQAALRTGEMACQSQERATEQQFKTF